MLSHEFKCLFVHIPKTAGMSIEKHFLNVLGLGDEQRHQLLLRPNDDPALGPPRLAHLKATDYTDRGHISAVDFTRYFKFSVVRNPWDRVVSMYRYLGHVRKTDFSDFVFNRLYEKLWREMYWFVRPQADFIYDQQGRLLIDHVIRFESLEENFTNVLEQLGLSGCKLPRVNSSSDRSGKANPPYQAYYKPETKLWVSELYRTDIERFGYRFE